MSSGDIKEYNSSYYIGERTPGKSIIETVNLLMDYDNECARSISVCGAEKKGIIKIYLYDGMINYPAYVFDELYLLGYHEHGKTDGITSPCTIYKKNGRSFIDEEINQLKKKSQLYYPAINELEKIVGLNNLLKH